MGRLQVTDGVFQVSRFIQERVSAIEATHRINEQIRITPVRVVGQNNEQLGVLATTDALEQARQFGLDLVEVAPDQRPPVCRIMDFGKFKYEQKRKQAKSAKTHQVHLKEIRLRPKTGEHDVDFKVKQEARGFLTDRDKVKVTVMSKGGEMRPCRSRTRNDPRSHCVAGRHCQDREARRRWKLPEHDGRPDPQIIGWHALLGLEKQRSGPL